MKGLVNIDGRDWDFSYSYELLLNIFKTIEAHKDNVPVKRIVKTELFNLERETFACLAMELTCGNLTENAIHIALVNSKYAAWFMERYDVSKVTTSVHLASAIRAAMRKNPRIVFRAEEQIKQERRK